MNLNYDTSDPRILDDYLEGDEVIMTSEALTYNRHASQVCSRWRALMLNSPSVWENSIELDSLGQKEDHWRTEVMRRTGNAPLTVVGEMDLTHTGHPYRWSFQSTPFFLKVLEENWERLRSLSIRSSDRPVYEKLRILSQRPAPNLEDFALFKSRGGEGNDITEGFIPFSNCAPRLRLFLCSSAQEFRLSGPCFNKLRSFSLKSSFWVFTAVEILQGLQQMPLLENLVFEHLHTRLSKPSGETTPPIQLCHLTSITVIDADEDPEDTDGAIFNVVPYIQAGRGCELTICNTDGFQGNVAQAISIFVKNNLDLPNTTAISYMLNDTPFESCSNLAIVFHGTPDASLHLSVVFLIPDEDYGVFYSMAKYLSRMGLHSVRKLTFYIRDVDLDDMSKHRSISGVIRFLQALKSVDELYSDDMTLCFLQGVDEHSQRRISTATNLPVATLPELSFLRTNKYDDSLTAYCRQRYEMGVPLRHVHVTGGEPVVPLEESGTDVTISWTDF